MKPEIMLEQLAQAKRIIENLPCKSDIISVEVRSFSTYPIKVHLSKGIKSTATHLGAKMNVFSCGDYTRMSIQDKYKRFEIIQLYNKKTAPGVTSTEDGTAEHGPTEDNTIITAGKEKVKP